MMHWQKVPALLCFALLVISGCKLNPVAQQDSATGELLFQSGFEAGVNVVSRNRDTDIIGADKTLSSHNDWVNDLDNHPAIGNFNIQFQGGDSTMRYARLVPDPTNARNQVLHFWLNEPNVAGSKGRIQANLYNNKGVKEFYQSVRVFLPNDFNTVRTFPKQIHWLTIAEFWNNITWSQEVPYGFRITLGLGKPTEKESDLHFILDAQDCELFPDGKQKYTTLWAETNEAVKVPIGKWFTMDYYYKEGNQQNGRFYLAIAPDGEKRKIVFDLHKITHNSQDPNPDGVTDFNPLKLYTSKELIAHMQRQVKTLQIYWDDFKLWKDKRPN
ncbi:hypothetical protein [Adhaeribacter rhizoryzae]|uniref:LamG domain-containing protein n=1 Tax=Adhaeribacter rhizoryzae TaxID=2607907 RepID=A0A5M6D2I1_9BACT|nr:hypothetical protein [Adhaeribacter rhizoryzae]KAA5540810.1 hypothetical protein F0145_22145 [Adhaeribacter rhizoryzae]